jgi:uncharacterized LabA/DUF88 family protein
MIDMGSQRKKARNDAIARRKRAQPARRSGLVSRDSARVGRAEPHKPLVNDLVHVFVDDQNLFWGLVNEGEGISFRIDFGQLLLEVSKNTKGVVRGIKTAYIAGVIPDDDSFWKVAKDRGFIVRRGFLGSGNRSKQDDAYLISDMVSTLYEQEGPSTIVLVAGDADYVPPLLKAKEKGWRSEVAFINRGTSSALDPLVHEFRIITPADIQLLR